jgi:hypothetical protein
MALKLEVGKTYLNRQGDRCSITEIMSRVNVARDSYGRCYNLDGTVGAPGAPTVSWKDLISEAPPVRTPCPTVHHADLIRAVLDGKVVQQEIDHVSSGYEEWKSIMGAGPLEAIKFILDWPSKKFRLKPESVVRWVPIFNNYMLDQSGGKISVGTREMGWQAATRDAAIAALCKHDQKVLVENKAGKLLRLELDPDTLAVISATTEAP